MAKHTHFLAAACVALTGAFTVSALPQADAVGTVRAVTALGDSYPSGAMGNEHNSYVERYGRMTSQRSLNYAFSGWQTGDVLYQLSHTAIENRNIRDSRTIIVTVGANDICEVYPDPSPAYTSLAPYSAQLHAMRSRLHTILGIISRDRGHSNARVVVTGYNNIYTDGATLRRQTHAYQVGAVKLTVQVNAVIKAEARYYGMTYVDPRPSFDATSTSADRYVIYDGTHPNSSGHQLYANLIYRAVH